MEQRFRDFVTIAAFGEFAEGIVDISDILTTGVKQKIRDILFDKFPQTSENESIEREIIRQIIRESVERVLALDAEVAKPGEE